MRGARSRVGGCVLVLVLLCAAEVRAQESAAGLTCSEIPASVSGIDLIRIDPAEPVVGDLVTLEFVFSQLVYQITNIVLLGAPPHFASPLESGTKIFHVRALEAGTAGLQLRVTYRSEELCTGSDGQTYYQPGPPHDVTSGVFNVQIAELPTPTPSATVSATVTPVATATPEATATRTPVTPLSGGCQVVAKDSGGHGLILLAVGLAILLIRRPVK